MEKNLSCLKVVRINFNLLNEGAIKPKYSHDGDSGMDLYIPNNYFLLGYKKLEPFERIMIDTGIKISFDKEYEVQIRSKSGRAIKEGIVVINQPGTIEHTYQGSLCVGLINLSNKTVIIENGKPIAQMVIVPVVNSLNSFIKSETFENLSDEEFFGDKSERGTGGIGSTYDEFKEVESSDMEGVRNND